MLKNTSMIDSCYLQTKSSMITGKVKIDKKTKNLVKRIKPAEIAIIDHRDLDQIAGKSLVEKKVKAVININVSISGKYPNKGPSVLLEAGIPVIDNCDPCLFSLLKDNDIVKIEEGSVYKNNKLIGQGRKLTKKIVREHLAQASLNLKEQLSKFIDNTLSYANKEKELILTVSVPDIGINFKGRHALIVVRGADYKEDLLTINSYIKEINPVIIGVDGGADACLEQGYKPDIIIGDMDSITDRALKCGAKMVVHAYNDGRAPGLERLEKLGLKAEIFPAPGTSEDIAMLLAHEQGAELITAVGTHSHMIDFLEKGRPGMASTLLVRLKVGNKLVDAKGVSKLYRSNISYHYGLQILLSVMIPLFILLFLSPPLNHFLQLLVLKLRLFFS